MTSLKGKVVGIIGLGRMGIRHLAAYKSLGAKIVAAADLKEEARNQAKSLYPSLNIYADWKELLEKEGLEMLSVVTNGPSHAEIVVAAAQRKIPIILCEKPMATSLRDADRMIEICKNNGSKLFINLILRVLPSFAKLIELLNSGVIGTVRHVSVSIAGRRGLGCVGTHYVDLMRLIVGGEVARTWGRIDKTGTPNSRGPQFFDPGGYGIYEFKNGARGFIEMSEDLPFEPHIAILGSRGRAAIDIADNSWELYKMEDNVGADCKPVKIPFEAGESIDLTKGTALALQDIVTGQDKIATGEDGKKALEMILGLHISDSRGNKLVEFPLRGADLKFDVQMT